MGKLARMAVREAMARLRRKMSDIMWLNPEYISRQIDTAPARFKDSSAGFRQPAPGAIAELPNIPTTAAGRSKFNIRYFDRDSRRAPSEKLELATSVKLLAATEEAMGETGIVATTGIFTTPAHLPGPSWGNEVEEITKYLAKNDLPPVPGRGHRFNEGALGS